VVTIVLTVGSGADAQSAVVPPPPARLVVGTSLRADLVLKDAAADPEHFAVEMTRGGARVTDLQSSNGTKLNGLFVSQGLLKPGDVLVLGVTTISVTGSGAPAGAPNRPTAPRPAAPPQAPRAGERPPAAPPPRRPAPARAPARPPAAPAVPPPKVVAGAARPAARPPRRRFNPIVLGLGAVLALVLVVALVVYQGRQGEISASSEAVNRAIAAWEKGDYDRARSAFEDVIDRWPESPAAAQAKQSIERIEASLARGRQALAERQVLDAQWVQLTFEEFKKDYEVLRAKYAETPAFEGPAYIDQVRKRYIEEGKRRFGEVRDRASRLLASARYSDAVLTWHEYIYIPQNIPPDIERATEEFRLIEKKSREDYDVIRKEVDELILARSFEEASTLLTTKLDTFRGTRHSYALMQKLGLIEVLRSGEETLPPEVIEARVTERQEYLKTAEEAESLEKRRLYPDAVAAWRRAADGCPDPKRAAEFRARADELTGIAELFTSLIRQIGSLPERFRKVDLGHGFKANAVGADRENLVVEVRGAQSKIAWERLGPERILALLVRLKLTPAEQLNLAATAFQTGNEEVAHKAITTALKEDESLTDQAFGVLARARRIPVPADGFVNHRGRWMTAKEKVEAELREAVAAAAKDARSSDLRRREEGLGKLREFGEPAEKTLVAVLTDLRESTVEELVRHPAVRDPAMKMILYKELQDRRKAALALIYDTVKYPYPHPDGPAYEKVQAEVDELVGKVRTIWLKPVDFITERNEDVAGLHGRAKEYSAELIRLGHQPEVPFDTLIDKVNQAIDMPRFTPDGTAKGNLEWSDQVLAYNDDIDIGLDEAEAECVRALNEYRMMMGRRAVKWSDKLLECARAHSQEMFDEGYFAHDCPLPGPEHDAHRKPTQRARQAGYGGGVSENIARGSTDGRATHWQWYGSSGHHRNLLGKGHVEVGVGRVDNFWTQNFGSANRAFDLPRKKPAVPEGE
jgi:uncharacterized protein YkwD